MWTPQPQPTDFTLFTWMPPPFTKAACLMSEVLSRSNAIYIAM
ncbi:Uncharacterised protein [Burkholderia pseudomallei]|nr:Uncharacterised protein [Burkholderia pseudomallei]CAJ3288676.1 Uncharacterised protein [Burkholderia pseudomallei]CAJ3604423.1 Uncharacterised protein [Burkholderia pseudomallei]CAJ3765606.1 Uncharacterised protein [Burkholderia pseudomallei]CAJ3849587.1 Uncharacterised protein [Burkholderia pseudomallei]